MNEPEWQCCQDPQVMLEFLKEAELLSPRKARLYGVAVCRRIWHLLYDERSRNAVEASEDFADGTPGIQLAEVEDAAFEASQGKFDQSILSQMGAYRHAAMAAWWVAGDTTLIDVSEVSTRAYGASVCDPNDREQEEPAQASLLRDIFGNPFRPAKLDASWLTESVVLLGRAAYGERQMPQGTLDNNRLAVLADALEEVGCGDEEILRHLREPGAVHVRGCFALDFLLGKT
jgi:hypothetical protein